MVSAVDMYCINKYSSYKMCRKFSLDIDKIETQVSFVTDYIIYICYKDVLLEKNLCVSKYFCIILDIFVFRSFVCVWGTFYNTNELNQQAS